MIAQVDGRELLYGRSMLDRDKCRQVIRQFRMDTASLKPDERTLPRLRHELTLKLCKTLFGTNQSEIVNCHTFLKGKLIGKLESPLIEHPSWKKLFDKIVAQDADQQMKSLQAKRKKNALKLYADTLKLWQEQEEAIQQALKNHNRQLAELNFEKLAAEIDQHASPTAPFRTALRSWVSHHQRIGNRNLQELFSIPHFATEFINWQLELIEDMNQSIYLQPPEKPQLRFLIRKLAAFIFELAPLQRTQQWHYNQMCGLNLGHFSLGCPLGLQLPMPLFPLTTLETEVFQADLAMYPHCVHAHQELHNVAKPIKLP